MTDNRPDSQYTISDLFCRENTAAVRALATVEIIFCHLGGVMYKVPLNPIYVFTPFGYLGVAVFFFFSGYNLYFNCLQRENRWKEDFWKKKFFRICLPFFLSNLLFELLSIKSGDSFHGLKALCLGILGVNLKNTTLWYIRSILLLYLLGYICFSFCPLFRSKDGKRRYLTASIIPLMTIYYFITSRYSVFPHFTVTIPVPFLVGALLALWGNRILPFWIRHREKLIFALTFILVYSAIYAADVELRLFVGGIEVYMTCATVALPLLAMTILIGKKISVPILSFVDHNSLEMYLLHNFCIQLYKTAFVIDNHYLFLSAYLATLVLLSVGLSKFCALCRKGFDAVLPSQGNRTAA